MRMLTIGTGPGPKNVLIEIDGKQIVTSYREYKKRMAESQYIVGMGIIQFDPVTRTVNNQEVTDITFKTPGAEGVLVRVTIWPEFKLDRAPEKGDWVAVDGKYSINTYDDKDGNKRSQAQISPTSLVVVPSVPKKERTVTGQTNAPIF